MKEHAELVPAARHDHPARLAGALPSLQGGAARTLTDRDLALYGFLGYPVLMAADIILYKATRVPVGADQVPTSSSPARSSEVQRPLRRRLPEPRPLLTEAAKVVGTDGRKMSKSYGNAIDLGEAGRHRRAKKIMGAVTDPAQAAPGSRATPRSAASSTSTSLQRRRDVGLGRRECRTAGIGCVDCKKKLLERLEPDQERMREKREALLARPGPRRPGRSWATPRARAAAAGDHGAGPRTP